MKVVIDRAIPLISGVLEPFAQVEYCDGAKISAALVADADALIIRTRTLCNKALLEGSSLRLICSATIGYDHIDLDYCAAHGIEVRTSAGCNARGVLQWFGAALSHLCRIRGWNPSERTVGVVGVGNVGSFVERYARMWGFSVICCDPPRAQREVDFVSTPLPELLAKSDVVTLHTPLDSSTHHMIDSAALSLMAQDAVVFNSSRGSVVDGDAIFRSGHDYIFDVWEGEPNISREQLEAALLATPHIAGYSVQGKARATSMVVNNIAHFFDLPLKGWQPDVVWCEACHIGWSELCLSIENYFDIKAQSDLLKLSPELFEKMRDSYKYRTEYF